jgi:hypothetical protein
MAQRTASDHKRTIGSRYFAVVTLASIVLSFFPIGLTLVSFLLSGSKGNAFDENGAGVYLWLLIVTIPAGSVFLAVGTLLGIVVGLVRELRR